MKLLPFEFPIYQYSVKNFKLYQQRLLEEIADYESEFINYRHNSSVFTDFYGDYSKNYLHNGTFNECVTDTMNQLSDDLRRPIIVKDVWAQRSRKGDYHCAHNHGASGWSAVFYVKFNPEKHKATTFYSPFTSPSSGNLLSYKPEVEEGDIVVFPAQTIHEARPNFSDEERVIISFNISSDDELNALCKQQPTSLNFSDIPL